MMEIKGITIHNTGNRLSAQELYDYLYYNDKLDTCHFLVDEKEVIITTDISQNAWHTGKGEDFGNMHTIAIEICQSRCPFGQYKRAQDRAMRLVVKLMKKYGLDASNLYFHKDFDKKSNCPHRILEMYENKQTFIKEELKKCIVDSSKK